MNVQVLVKITLEEIVICFLQSPIVWCLGHISRANHDGSIDTTLEATAVLLGDKQFKRDCQAMRRLCMGVGAHLTMQVKVPI